MPTYRTIRPREKRGNGLTLAFVVIGVVVTLLGLSYRRTHTAASDRTHATPARETSAPAPAQTTPASKSSSSDRNG